mgnify:CR=1 FL=1
MKKSLNILINVVLFIVIVFLAIMVVKSIQAPIKFGNEKKAREVQVIQRLLDIRAAELQYKQAYNHYTSNFDTLINFCANGEIPIIKIVPDPNDTTFTLTINDTLGYVKVVDSLFSNRDNFNVNDLRYVPFSDNQEFELADSTIKRSGISVPVFEAKAHYSVYLNGMDDQRVRNAIAEQEDIDKYAGLKVGSLEEASTEGNWEKL